MPANPCLGQIILFAGNFAPVGWALCQGQILPINSNQALFSLLGTTFGGDGRTTFGLPDLRGRAPVHVGTGTGLTPRQWGGKYGVENVAVSASEMASHTHTATTTATAQSRTVSEAASPANRVWAPSSPGDSDYAGPSAMPSAMAPVAMVGQTTLGSTGAGWTHTNIMPTITINHIIAMVGIFPVRN
ncbi:MAG: microcystin-dependent protein [Phycisphaerales bacterium]|jgi:microcystin-dependent protein